MLTAVFVAAFLFQTPPATQPASPAAASAAPKTTKASQEAPNGTLPIWISAAGFIISVLTFVAVYWQTRYMREALEVSKRQTTLAEASAHAANKSADAAELSARLAKKAAEEGMLPDLELVDIHLQIPMRKETDVYFVIRNHGRGPAINVKARGWMAAVMPKTNIDPEPALIDCRVPPKIRGENESVASIGPLGVLLDFSAQQRVFSMNDMLAAKIEVTYTDAFGNPYEPIIAVGVQHGQANGGHFTRIA